MWASHRWALSVAGTFSCGWGLCGQSASPAGGGRLPGISGDASADVGRRAVADLTQVSLCFTQAGEFLIHFSRKVGHCRLLSHAPVCRCSWKPLVVP